MKTKIEFLNNYLNNGGRKDSIYSIASLLSTGDGHKRDNISNIANSEGWSILKKKKKKNCCAFTHNTYCKLLCHVNIWQRCYNYILYNNLHIENPSTCTE